MHNGPIFTALVRFFAEEGWQVRWLQDTPVLSMPFEGDNGRWLCYAQAREEQQQAVFYSIAPFSVPVDRRLAVAEFITRANYGMILGNFELDFDDGEVRYKTSIDVDEAELATSLVRPLVYANVSIMDRYLPGLIHLVNDSSITARDAIHMVENEGSDGPPLTYFSNSPGYLH